MPDAPSRAPAAATSRLLVGISLAEVALALAASVLVVVGGPGDSVSCSSYPSCLGSPGTEIGLAHVGAAGALLVLALVGLLLAVRSRRDPRTVAYAGIALVVLVGMAALGSAFATGAVPNALAPIQFAFLAAFVGANVLCARRAWGGEGAGPSATARPSRPASPGGNGP